MAVMWTGFHEGHWSTEKHFLKNERVPGTVRRAQVPRPPGESEVSQPCSWARAMDSDSRGPLGRGPRHITKCRDQSLKELRSCVLDGYFELGIAEKHIEPVDTENIDLSGRTNYKHSFGADIAMDFFGIVPLEPRILTSPQNILICLKSVWTSIQKEGEYEHSWASNQEETNPHRAKFTKQKSMSLLKRSSDRKLFLLTAVSENGSTRMGKLAPAWFWMIFCIIK